MTQDELKKAVGWAALQYVQPGTIVGVGTGSTAAHFIDALGTMKGQIEGAVSSSDASTEKLTGDLLFFGNAPGKVSHVALYLNDGKYIHSSGQVKINSIDARDTDYYAIPLLGISRVVNKIGTPGITAVKRHPWYFEQK